MLAANAVALGAAAAIAGVSLLALEYRQFKNELVTELHTQASILARNSTGSLAFADPVSATEILTALKDSPNIEQAVVRGAEGRPFATYIRADLAESALAQMPPEGEHFGDGYVVVGQKIELDHEQIGTIAIRSDLNRFKSSLAAKVAVGFALAVLGLLLAFFVLSRLQAAITGPIFDMLDVMSRVSRDGDYSARAPSRGAQELALLANGFNEMLSQVEYHRQNLESLVTSRTAEMRRAMDAEKRFLATISHEMRTPLNAIIGFADLLAGTELAEEQRKFLANVRSSSQHLLALINDVLDVSKIDAGQMELRESAVFCMKDLMVDCLTLVSSGTREGVQPSIVADEPPFYVKADQTRVKQILLNLMSNAMKFTKEGQVRLTLHGWDDAAGGAKARFRISVEDTGVGIDADRLPHLFAPFKQVHDGGFSGTGMGLFISRSLARMMGGDIEVQSQKGMGSRFTVTLELAKDAAKSARKAEQPAPAPAPNADYSRLRVLLVEDVDMNIALAEQIFKRFFGFVPDVAKNGLEALERAKEKPYDLVFMDVQMPQMDGITATRELRARGFKAPIVAMTANALASDVEAAKAAGVNDYITKPIKPDTIAKSLAAIFAPADDRAAA